jgi:hypothetical protein
MLINSCSDDRILPSPDAAVDQSVGAFSKVEWVDLKELIPALYLQRAAKKLRVAE